MKENSQLVNDILIGGTIYAPQRYGKTVAALQAMACDTKLHLLVINKQFADDLGRDYPDLKDRIISKNMLHMFNYKKEYIVDESDWIDIPSNIKIHAKITSPKVQVVLYTKDGKRHVVDSNDVLPCPMAGK